MESGGWVAGNDVGNLDALSYDNPAGPDLDGTPIWWSLEALKTMGWPQPSNSDLTGGGDEESFGETTIGSNSVNTASVNTATTFPSPARCYYY